MLGTTPGTLRKWEETGELLPARKTRGGTRYYAVADLLKLGDTDAPAIGYAHVSSHEQKADLHLSGGQALGAKDGCGGEAGCLPRSAADSTHFQV